MPRKLMVKILNRRLSNILASKCILQSNQFAGLPGGSTLSPIAVVQHIIDDTKKNNKELWLYLQDMSKCYDRVDLRILHHAMLRLRIPEQFINLVLSLFQNRRNYVLTDAGVTNDYDVLVGIDQGEVISPLLWCIYYRIVPKISTPFLHIMLVKVLILLAKFVIMLVRGAYYRGVLIFGTIRYILIFIIISLIIYSS